MTMISNMMMMVMMVMALCGLILPSGSFPLLTRTDNAVLRNAKYVQGIDYRRGHLVFGTDDGHVCCMVNAHPRRRLLEKWTTQVSMRNLRRISGNDDYVLVTCDPIDSDEVSRTVVCDLETGGIRDTKVWTDTTVFESLTSENEWVRLNVYGELMTKLLHRDDEFTRRLGLPLRNSDFVTAATIHKNKLYVITMDAKLFIVSLENFNMVAYHSLHIDVPTCIHVIHHPSTAHTNVEFLFVGNYQGMIHFAQLNDDKITSQTHKRMRETDHDAIVTQIRSNHHGVFASFDSAEITGIEMMSFRELFRIKTPSPTFINVDAFCVSPMGLFYIDNDKREIRLETLQPHRKV